MTTTASAWDPTQYGRFADERSQPFYDLAALIQRQPGMRVIDLGCGTGELTSWLHGELDATETVGVDSSDSMLAQAAQHAREGLRFEAGDIREWEPSVPVDLVFSNAALQWVDGHEELWSRFASWLAPGGQIAIQMPMNDDHVSHVTARELAQEEPFATHLEGYARAFPTLEPERYASLLYSLGFEQPHVRLQVYGHVLPETRAVVEWVKGSLLTAYRERLDADSYAAFLEEYTQRVEARIGEQAPYFYPFKRVLMWGRKAR